MKSSCRRLILLTQSKRSITRAICDGMQWLKPGFRAVPYRNRLPRLALFCKGKEKHLGLVTGRPVMGLRQSASSSTWKNIEDLTNR